MGINPTSGPQGPSLDPTSVPIAQQEIHVSKTTQKTDIPPVASESIKLHPSSQEFSIKIETNPTAIDQAVKDIEKDITTLKKTLDEEFATEISQKAKILQDNLKIVEGIQIPTEIMHVGLTEPYDYIEPLLPIPEDAKTHLGRFVMGVEVTRTALQTVGLVGDGTALILQGIHYQQTKKLLKIKDQEFSENPENIELKNTIDRLKHYLRILWEDIKNKIIDFASGFVSVSLKTASFVMSVYETIAPLLKGGVQWAISLLDIIAEAIALWRAKKAKTTHENWMVHIAQDQKTLPEAEKLLIARQKRMIIKKIDKMEVQELQKKLEEKKIDFQGKNFDVLKFKQQFKNLIENDSEFLREVSNKFIEPDDEHEDTINVMTRQGIRSLADEKARNEEKFFVFKLTKSQIALTLACLSTAATIILEVLAITGVVALSASALAIPGLGFFALGLILAGIGLYFFYKYKPNLFKCFVQGVNLRLALFQIPAKIRALQLSIKTTKLAELQTTNASYEQLQGLLVKEQTLKNMNCPKNCQKILEQLGKEIAKKKDRLESHGITEQELLLEQLQLKQKENKKQIFEVEKQKEEAQKKVDAWTGEKGTLTILQNRLKEAGTKDFALANGLLEIPKDPQAKKEEMNVPLNIVKKILVNGKEIDPDFDEETIKIFKEKMNIDINQLRIEVGSMDKEKLMSKLKEFFKMDDSELLTYMKARLNEKEIALSGKAVAA
jgi:hypothetical protein